MKYKFLADDITSENINTEIKNTPILFQNNQGQIESILNFFQTDTSVLVATGFLGTGKTGVISECMKALNQETILLWANCYESTNLDDIFLGFFEQFKHLASQNIIKVPQAKFNNFHQRINAYFYSISKPIVIVLNSFQELIPENAKHVLDFITHLSEFAKIKTIIISRNFDLEKLDKKVKVEKINFKALDKELFQKYITQHKVHTHGPVLDEFYNFTKGYYFYITLALKIMELKKLSPIQLIQNQANSFVSLKEFLFGEFLSMVDPVGGHLLRFLTVIRYPVNTKLLQSLNLYDEQRLQMLVQNSIIEIDQGNIYLKDYYKDIIEGIIPNTVLIKLHRACAELYEMQLPRKPEERDLLISRRTIRQEIEYHNIFIPKKVELKNNLEIFNAQALMVQTNKPEPITAQTELLKAAPTTTGKPKELKDLLFVFDEEEENNLLTDIANSLNAFITQAQLQDENENKMDADELLQLLEETEKIYDFKHVITLGEKLLLKTNENKLQALTHKKIANAYSQITDSYNALKHFTSAHNLYKELDDLENTGETKYFMAKMYYQMFKRQQAKELLLDFKNETNKSLKLKANLLLFDIYMEEGDEDNAFETCKTAMKLTNKSENPSTICELLFKCGLILETRNNTYRAIEAYEKTLKFSDNPEVNPYLAQTYSNLTTLYAETENITLAQKYAQKALNICNKTNNDEGLYLANLKLAQLENDSDKTQICTYFEAALQYAQKLQDNFYITSALIAYGDFLYNKNELINALEKYFSAHTLTKNNFLEENLSTLERRILDVKYRVTEEIFNKKAKEFNYEQ